MIFIPPSQPKPPPSDWTELQEAALVILEKEIALDEDEFEAWLRQRPGATAIYLFLVDEHAIRAELINQVLSHPVSPFKMPDTLAELIDDDGRMPRQPVVSVTSDFDMRHYQRNALSAARYAKTHPKGP